MRGFVVFGRHVGARDRCRWLRDRRLGMKMPRVTEVRCAGAWRALRRGRSG